MGVEKGIFLTEKDLEFVTNGSCTEGTVYGDHHHAPNGDAEVLTSGRWSLWENIANTGSRPLDIRRSSALIFQRLTGNLLTITTLDDKIILILQTSANGIHAVETL